jgi:hypothetical protein
MYVVIILIIFMNSAHYFAICEWHYLKIKLTRFYNNTIEK